MVDIRIIAEAVMVGPTRGGVALLVLVLRMGHVGKGAQRWIDFGGTLWQPSEWMKLALVTGAGASVPQGVVGAAMAIRCS
jgi:rod shape determining protein RodA